MERCSPHAWRTPVVGDLALACDECECRLDLARHITAEVQANIMRDYRRHFGPIVSGHFEEALEAAAATGGNRPAGWVRGTRGGERLTCGAS